MYEYPTTNRRAVRRRHQRQRQRRRRLFFLFLLLAAGLLLLAWLCLQRGSQKPVQPLAGRGDELEYPLGASGVEWQEDKLSYIQGHPELYPTDLIDLAQRNEEALDYVYQYPELAGTEPEIDLSAEAAGDSVPLLIQWDSRWGYHEYGGGLIGYTGCGPTCLSMVALYLTGDSRYTPTYIADYSVENGYYVSGSGTAWTLMSQGCAGLGLTARELPWDERTMAAALEAGEPIICSMGPGDFTDTGHYIVLTGYTGGGFTVNDPNSPERSTRTWTFDELNGQVRNLWAFTANREVRTA